MSIKKFLKNYIIEQDENLVSISPDNYLEVLTDVGGIASRVAALKPYRNKGIVITGPINLSNFKNIGPLTGIVRVMGRLDISHTNVSSLKGITVDGYVSDYGSAMWRNKMQTELDIKLAELNVLRANDEWNVETGDDDAERTEALYEYIETQGDVDMVEDEEGNEIPEDKYYIHPSGRATYGYGKQYEWLGGGNGFSPNTYDVYTESEVDNAARNAVENMIDDMGHGAFSEWVWQDALDKESWRSWLEDFYSDIIRDDPENYDIPFALSATQQAQVDKLKNTVKELEDKLTVGNLPEDQVNNIKKKIEGFNNIIEDIEEDPQGDYDEDLIEEEINDRVNEYDESIGDFIEHFGYDKNFIMDFVDVGEVADTVVRSDGYGSLLNSHDGDYDTTDINGTTYYIMRAS